MKSLHIYGKWNLCNSLKFSGLNTFRIYNIYVQKIWSVHLVVRMQDFQSCHMDSTSIPTTIYRSLTKISFKIIWVLFYKWPLFLKLILNIMRNTRIITISRPKWVEYRKHPGQMKKIMADYPCRVNRAVTDSHRMCENF